MKQHLKLRGLFAPERAWEEEEICYTAWRRPAFLPSLMRTAWGLTEGEMRSCLTPAQRLKDVYLRQESFSPGSGFELVCTFL